MSPPGPAEPNTTNRDVENAAISHVVAYEAARGRSASDSRGTGAAGDLMSGDRIIEVKAYGRSARGQELWLEVRQVQEAQVNPRFWLYLVENVRQGDPEQFTVLEIGGADLQALIARARERRYYEVPLPTRTYDALQRAAGSQPR